MKIFNTLTKNLDEFHPINKNLVLMYSCGPTVYSRAHIGNLRAYVFADTLKRALTVNGYKVKNVINITDVGHLTDDADQGEDKIEKAAKERNKTAEEIAEYYTSLFLEDLKKLNIDTENTIFPKATSCIDTQIELIKKLEAKGYTYKTSDGIYFDTSKFPYYGILGGIDKENLKPGARVALISEKLNPTDFALWKFSKPEDKRLQEWDSPWGVGFPGWHIECSALIWKHLGKRIDIHTGGVEHIPVHHNNEIAQTESITEQPLANYWIHIEHLLVDGQKMSKSLNNILSLDDLEEKGYSPFDYKFLLLQSHYKSQINFTFKALESAKIAYSRLKTHFETNNIPSKTVENEYTEKIKQLLSDNLNTPEAIAFLFEFAKDKNIPKSTKIESAPFFEKALGIPLLNKPDCLNDTLPKDLKEKLSLRQQARKQKDFETADKIREEFRKKGYEIIDTSDGQCVKKK